MLPATQTDLDFEFQAEVIDHVLLVCLIMADKKTDNSLNHFVIRMVSICLSFSAIWIRDQPMKP